MIEGAKWRRWVYFYLPLGVFVFMLLFPFYWMLVTTFRPDAELYRPWMAPNYTPFWTAHPTLDHIRYLFTETLFGTWMVNTLFIPLADIIRNYHLGDTPWALILTYPTFLIPFCTWLLMGYFKAIPRELEECARIDGATRWKAMVYIVFPIAVPGILSAGIFAFTLSWNEFIYALVFLSSPEQKTVPVGVTSELVRGDVFYWGQLMAGALLGSIPVAFVYSFFVEHYVAGLTGSVKG